MSEDSLDKIDCNIAKANSLISKLESLTASLKMQREKDVEDRKMENKRLRKLIDSLKEKRKRAQ